MTYTLISPISFAIGLGLLTAAVAFANTPLLKGGAIAAFAGWLFIFIISVQIPALPPMISGLVFATLTVPTLIGLGMVFMEYGRL